MACYSEVRLPIEYGRITREDFPSELYGYQQNDKEDTTTRVNVIWLVALMPLVAIISLSWMWVLSKRLKTKLLKDTKELVSTFNEQDTPRTGVSWRFKSHRTDNDDFAEEFLIITLPNVRLSSKTASAPATLRHQGSDTTIIAFPVYDSSALSPIAAAKISPLEQRHNIDSHTLITISPPSYNDVLLQNDASSMISVSPSTSPRRGSFSPSTSPRRSSFSRPSSRIAGSANRGHRVDYDTLQITNDNDTLQVTNDTLQVTNDTLQITNNTTLQVTNHTLQITNNLV
ncbi:6341_t:CDS:2 [Ambispora leptoticha]|uniref:6341_t:CDS:1 n=1 Tax=Ambispora leptoticha TaxID=144679 RepID=A0A9N9AAK7_9GLOM|nr:6341_t:CDS:2 [Ambispora leptoticha]